MRITKTVLWRINFGNNVLWREESTKMADVRLEVWKPILSRMNQNDDKKIRGTK